SEARNALYSLKRSGSGPVSHGMSMCFRLQEPTPLWRPVMFLTSRRQGCRATEKDSWRYLETALNLGESNQDNRDRSGSRLETSPREMASLATVVWGSGSFDAAGQTRRGEVMRAWVTMMSATVGCALALTLAVSCGSAVAVVSLPDGRAWEMVSPLDKNGGEINGIDGVIPDNGPPEGGIVQASGD